MDLGEDALNFIMLFGVTLFGVIAGGIVPALFGGVLESSRPWQRHDEEI